MSWQVYAFLGAFATALSLLLEKKTLFKEHSINLSAAAAIFNFVLLLFFIDRVNFSINEYMLLLYIGSWLATFGFWFTAKAVRHSQLSSLAPLFNLGPLVVFFLSFLYLGERITGVQFVGILFFVLGAYILERKSDSSALEPFKILFKSKYLVIFLIAILLYAFSTVIDKFLLSFYDSFSYLFIASFFIMINFFILSFIFGDGFKGIKITLKNNLFFILLFSLLVILRRLFYLEAASLALISLVYPVYRLSSLLTTLIGGEIFHEKEILKKTIACIFMLFGVYLILV